MKATDCPDNYQAWLELFSIIIGVTLFAIGFLIDRYKKRRDYKYALRMQLRSLFEATNLISLKKIAKENIAPERVEVRIDMAKEFFSKLYEEPVSLSTFIRNAHKESGAELKNVHLLLAETETVLRGKSEYDEFGLFGACYLMYFFSEKKKEKKDFFGLLKDFLELNPRLYKPFLKNWH
jgi:hypothetical protein